VRTTAEERAEMLVQDDPYVPRIAADLCRDIDDAIRENERLQTSIAELRSELATRMAWRLTATARKLTDENTALRDQLRWRKCEEELPPQVGDPLTYPIVSVWVNNREMKATYVDGDGFKVGGLGWLLCPTITHWRPLGPGQEEGK